MSHSLSLNPSRLQPLSFTRVTFYLHLKHRESKNPPANNHDSYFSETLPSVISYRRRETFVHLEGLIAAIMYRRTDQESTVL